MTLDWWRPRHPTSLEGRPQPVLRVGEAGVQAIAVADGVVLVRHVDGTYVLPLDGVGRVR
jgi:hypothetical protein